MQKRTAPKESLGYAVVMAPQPRQTDSDTSPVGRSRSRATSSSSTKNETAVRSSDGRFVPKPSASFLAATADEMSERAAGKRATVQQVPVRAGSRSKAADDPLAPERTRWLADVVGGGARLAELLGVSASQTSRWAAGQERPGIRVAPLLIDLEHVLARVRLVWAEPAATTWMTSANAHLGGARPVDVLRLHGPGPVLDALDVGAWGGAA